MNSTDTLQAFQRLGGEFQPDVPSFLDRLSGIKAFLFDWDGVFNDGSKTGQGGSTFSEPDIMGTNLLRLGYWLRHHRQLPAVGILTGAQNPAAQRIAKREHYQALFMGVKYKPAALDCFCQQHRLQPREVAYVFDDVNDLKVARLCGLRCLVRREASPLMEAYARARALYDYRTARPGGRHAVRELCELLLGSWGVFEEVVQHRTEYDDLYQAYLAQRAAVDPAVFVEAGKGTILPQSSPA